MAPAIYLAAALCGGILIQPNSPRLLRQFTSGQIAILEKMNRADRRHITGLTVLVLPAEWHCVEGAYATLPRIHYPFLDLEKVLVAHLPSQQFGAYEHGSLALWGPLNSGARKSPTPAGVYRLNWRSKSRHSTVDPDWLMTWYWNIDDPLGIAMHAYDLPGRPASHSCIRLLDRDARWLYDWGEPGVPVYVIGQYDFQSPPPWRDPAWWRQGVELQ